MQLAMILFRQHQLKSNIHGSRSYADNLPRQRTQPRADSIPARTDPI